MLGQMDLSNVIEEEPVPQVAAPVALQTIPKEVIQQIQQAQQPVVQAPEVKKVVEAPKPVVIPQVKAPAQKPAALPQVAVAEIKPEDLEESISSIAARAMDEKRKGQVKQAENYMEKFNKENSDIIG